MKINIYHIDTCLPDFFGGHHKAHLQVPVDCNTSIEDLRSNLLSELYQGAVAGSDIVAMALLASPMPNVLTSEEADEVGFIYSQWLGANDVTIFTLPANYEAWEEYCGLVYETAVKAVEELEFRSEFPFRDLDCGEESVYAYFILESEL